MVAAVLLSIVGLMLALGGVPILIRAMRHPFGVFVWNRASRGVNRIDIFTYLLEVNVIAVSLAYFLGNPVVQTIPGVDLLPGNYKSQLAFVAVVLIIVGALRLQNTLFPRFVSQDIIVWTICGMGILFYAVVTNLHYLMASLDKVVNPANPESGLMAQFTLFGSAIAVLYVELLQRFYRWLKIAHPDDPDDPDGQQGSESTRGGSDFAAAHPDSTSTGDGPADAHLHRN